VAERKPKEGPFGHQYQAVIVIRQGASIEDENDDEHEDEMKGPRGYLNAPRKNRLDGEANPG
jgi:hypothetical protein